MINFERSKSRWFSYCENSSIVRSIEVKEIIGELTEAASQVIEPDTGSSGAVFPFPHGGGLNPIAEKVITIVFALTAVQETNNINKR